jgi:hypothetical protein
MDIHPRTKYEMADLRHEERLRRARSAMRAVEIREARRAVQASGEPPTCSWLDRILRRREVMSEPTPLRSPSA